MSEEFENEYEEEEEEDESEKIIIKIDQVWRLLNQKYDETKTDEIENKKNEIIGDINRLIMIYDANAIIDVLKRWIIKTPREIENVQPGLDRNKVIEVNNTKIMYENKIKKEIEDCVKLKQSVLLKRSMSDTHKSLWSDFKKAFSKMVTLKNGYDGGSRSKCLSRRRRVSRHKNKPRRRRTHKRQHKVYRNRNLINGHY